MGCNAFLMHLKGCFYANSHEKTCLFSEWQLGGGVAENREKVGGNTKLHPFPAAQSAHLMEWPLG